MHALEVHVRKISMEIRRWLKINVHVFLKVDNAAFLP